MAEDEVGVLGVLGVGVGVGVGVDVGVGVGVDVGVGVELGVEVGVRVPAEVPPMWVRTGRGVSDAGGDVHGGLWLNDTGLFSRG